MFIFRRNFRKYSTRELCVLAMLIAITAILAIYCTFRIGTAIKIPTKFISIFVTGVFFGPGMAGLVAALGDVLNAFLAPVGPWMPQITAMEFLSGFVFGLFFYQKPIGGRGYVIRAIVCALVQAVLDLVVMTEILVLSSYFPTWQAGFVFRLPAGIIKALMQLVVLLVAAKCLPVFQKEVYKKDFKNYANSFQTVSKLGLERISALLDEMGNPQDTLQCIHIAGTNGKGSVAAFLQAILTKAGYKTGKYISPNMYKVNERISIDGCDISDSHLEKLLEKLEKISATVQEKTGEMPTQFEIWTAAAFSYFADKNCDFVVLETGLGGRFDATNVISQNAMSIITRIDIDHTEYLGDTLSKIAAEKAGIIKSGSPVIIAPQDAAAADVIRMRAAELGNRLMTATVPAADEFAEIYEIFNLDGIRAKLSLGGAHQLENAAVAVCAARELGILDGDIVYGLEHAKNPGRFQLMAEDLVYDGAHNPDGVRALIRNLERYYPDREKVYIMASMQDKDITENLMLLGNTGGEFRFVGVRNNPRSATGERLKEKAVALGFEATAYNSLAEALCVPKGKLTIVCGSLYLYPDLDADCLEKYKKYTKNT